MPPLTNTQRQMLADALAYALEQGDEDGHAGLVDLLNQLGYVPLCSSDAEAIAQQLLA